jgi:Holliday junction resolvase RusA-like endonuclease
MAKKLKIKEYNEKYKDIPKTLNEIFPYLWDSLNIKEKDLPIIRKMIKSILGIKKEKISFVFYFVPEATPRPRYSSFTHSFYVKNANDYGKIFDDFVKSIDNIPFITTPCSFKSITYKPTPSAMTKYEKLMAELGLIHDISKPDWDNLAKTYCDMIQHGLILDDSIIYKGSLEKRYSLRPRIEITIEYYLTHDSTFNQKRIDKILQKYK